MTTRHEVARFAVRANVAADKLADRLDPQVERAAKQLLAQVVAALRSGATAPEKRAQLLRLAAATKANPAVVDAMTATAGRALRVGADAAAAEVGPKAPGIVGAEETATAAVLRRYAAENERRLRLGIFQDALAILDATRPEFLPDVADTVARALPLSWQGPDANRVQLITTSLARNAMGLGRMTVLRRPVSKAQLPYWYFTAILDENTSDLCIDCDGVLLPAGHPWWTTRTPQLHFKCRSAIVGVTKAQMEALGGVTKDPPDVIPQEGFGKAGGLCVLDPSPPYYDRALLQRLK